MSPHVLRCILLSSLLLLSTCTSSPAAQSRVNDQDTPAGRKSRSLVNRNDSGGSNEVVLAEVFNGFFLLHGVPLPPGSQSFQLQQAGRLRQFVEQKEDSCLPTSISILAQQRLGNELLLLSRAITFQGYAVKVDINMNQPDTSWQLAEQESNNSSTSRTASAPHQARSAAAHSAAHAANAAKLHATPMACSFQAYILSPLGCAHSHSLSSDAAGQCNQLPSLPQLMQWCQTVHLGHTAIPCQCSCSRHHGITAVGACQRYPALQVASEQPFKQQQRILQVAGFITAAAVAALALLAWRLTSQWQLSSTCKALEQQHTAAANRLLVATTCRQLESYEHDRDDSRHDSDSGDAAAELAERPNANREWRAGGASGAVARLICISGGAAVSSMARAMSGGSMGGTNAKLAFTQEKNDNHRINKATPWLRAGDGRLKRLSGGARAALKQLSGDESRCRSDDKGCAGWSALATTINAGGEAHLVDAVQEELKSKTADSSSMEP